jgi:4-amino-4-deoxy-L-arabinose transferase-like glycosyltransferase
LLGLAVVLLAFGYLLCRNFAPAISEPDDNGYFAQGTLLAQTGHTWFKPQSDAQYIGMHWLIAPGETFISRYPPGLAVIIAVVYKLFGYKATLWTNPALAILALVGMFFLSRRLVATGWALAATVVLAANPQFVHHALSGDSHIGVTCFLVWGMYWLLRWSQEPGKWLALFAGLCFGVVPTIRYPDSVMALGIAAFLLWHVRSVQGVWKQYLWFVIGFAVPILPLLIRNQLLLGAFWRTGYALTNEQTGFSWEYFKEHALGYVQTINSGGLGLLFGLGIVGITSMICIRKTRPLGVMFALCAVPMLLLYMAYYWAPQMNSAMTMRFLLPTFPAYVLAGVWAMSVLLENAPRGARVAVPIVVLAMQMLWGTSDLIDETRRLHWQKDNLARVTDALEKHAQRGDVIVGSNQILQQLDFVREWKIADESLARGGGMRGRGGPMGPDDDPDAPSPMQREKREEQSEKYTGTTMQKERKFAADVRRWADGHKIYLVGSEDEVMNGSEIGQVQIVARLTLPERPGMLVENQRGGFGGRRGAGRGMGGRQMAGGPGAGGPGMGFGPNGRGGFGGAGGGLGGGPGGGGLGGPGGGGPNGRFGGPGGGPGGGPMGGLTGEIVIAEWTFAPNETSERLSSGVPVR